MGKVLFVSKAGVSAIPRDSKERESKDYAADQSLLFARARSDLAEELRLAQAAIEEYRAQIKASEKEIKALQSKLAAAESKLAKAETKPEKPAKTGRNSKNKK